MGSPANEKVSCSKPPIWGCFLGNKENNGDKINFFKEKQLDITGDYNT